MTDSKKPENPIDDVVVGATSGSAAPPADDLAKGGLGVGTQKDDRFPAGIPYIVGNEGAERFSFYGMKAILYVYMATLYMQMMPGLAQDAANAQATQVTHLFMAGVYAFPMIGAILADRLLGKYNVILWVSLIYTAGHAVLAVAGRLEALGQLQGAEYGMYLGLALIAIGSGGIKPCVSANVGDQFGPSNAHLVTRIYQIFYFIINFGSFFSTLITPLLYKHYGAEVAFGVPGVLMALATFVFWLGRKKFRRVPPNPGGKLGLLDSAVGILLFTPLAALIVAFFAGGHEGEQTTILTYAWHIGISIAALVLAFVLFAWRQRIQRDSGLLAVTFYAFTNRRRRVPGEGFFEVARKEFGDEAVEGPPAVLRIMVVFSMVLFFWALFDQHSSTWIEQAKRMDRVLSVPYWVSGWVAVAVVGLAVLGLAWLMAWVSNKRVPRLVSFGVLGLVAAAGVAALIMDVVGTAEWLGNERWRTLELEAPQLSALNPLMVMAIIPALNFGVYQPLERRGIEFKPLARMSLGMFLAAAAFGAAAILQMRVEAAGTTPHVLWQAVQYLVMTTAEVLVSITALEFAYTQAPRSMKSTIMGFWLLTVTGGNMLVAFLAPLQEKLSLSEFFWLFTGLMAAAALIFTVLAYFYKGKSYLQQDAA